MPVEPPPWGAFDDGLPDIKVMPLDHTISLGVIGGDVYMPNIVFIGKDIESLNKGGPLSVTISAKMPQRQRISSKIKEARVEVFSEHNICHSG